MTGVRDGGWRAGAVMKSNPGGPYGVGTVQCLGCHGGHRHLHYDKSA